METATYGVYKSCVFMHFEGVAFLCVCNTHPHRYEPHLPARDDLSTTLDFDGGPLARLFQILHRRRASVLDAFPNSTLLECLVGCIINNIPRMKYSCLC